MSDVKIISSGAIQAISYTGQLRFQERGNRRYLQQQRRISTIDGAALNTRYEFEDVPMVDEQGNPIEAKLREPRS